MSSIVLLGSTGSIGVNTLIIAKHYNITIEALVAGNNIDLLNEQINIYQPKIVAIANAAEEAPVSFIKSRRENPASCPCNILCLHLLFL